MSSYSPPRASPLITLETGLRPVAKLDRPDFENAEGHGTLFSGPMAAGKSTTLYEILNEMHRCGNDVLLLLPGHVLGESVAPKASRDGVQCAGDYKVVMEESGGAKPRIDSALRKDAKTRDAIFVDELQFFSSAFVLELIALCAEHELPLIASGLDTDYRQCAFPTYEHTHAKFERVFLLKADCDQCMGKRVAIHSHLRQEEALAKPADSDGKAPVLLDTKDLQDQFDSNPALSKYMSLCEACSLQRRGFLAKPREART